MPRNFRIDEVQGLDPAFVRLLDDARDIAKAPFVITSGYRQGDPKAHGLGKAVDLRCSTSNRRQRMYDALRAVGIKRIGIYDRHLHADVATKADDPKYDQNVTWWGKSKVRA